MRHAVMEKYQEEKSNKIQNPNETDELLYNKPFELMSNDEMLRVILIRLEYFKNHMI